MSSDDEEGTLIALIIEIILIVVYNPITDTLFGGSMRRYRTS